MFMPPDELRQCDTICRMYSKYRCVPTPRPPRVRPDTISFTITSIIVSLSRSGAESNDISLPRPVMCMCLIIMLTLLLFPRFYSCLFFCASNTTRSNRFQTHTHALGPPVTSIIVSLPRSGVSDDISLSRSVMHMCLISMLKLILFPRFCLCLFSHKQHNSLEPFPKAHTRSRPPSIGD